VSKAVKINALGLSAFMMVNGLWAQSSFSQAPYERICAKEISYQMQQWHVKGDAQEEPTASVDGYFFKLPTEKIGRWALVYEESDQVRLSLVDSERIQLKVLDSHCAEITATDIPNTGRTNIGFDDEDLTDLLLNNNNGLVYIWSPHMLLSVHGIKELLAIGLELGISVTILLDVNADINFAQSTVREYSLPATVLTPATALEFKFRGALIHSPTLLFYQDTSFVRPDVPGYRHPEHYRQVILDRLALSRVSLGPVSLGPE